MKICNTCWDKFIKNEPIYPNCQECISLQEANRRLNESRPEINLVF